MGRLLAVLGGVAWLGVIAAIALAVHRSGEPRPVPRLSTFPPLLTQLNDARPAAQTEHESWIVTRATSAHKVLVVDVRAARAADAREIAGYIVGAVADRRYDEVLVYVWSEDGRRQFADRRVQWTPRGEYVELVIGD